MNYLDKYKVGSMLFRTLSEGRMRLKALGNAFLFDHAPPDFVIEISQYVSQHRNALLFTTLSGTFDLKVPDSPIIPESARGVLAKDEHITFPQTFVASIPNARVLGDGTVIVGDNAILSNTTTDFHRKMEHHHLLYSLKLPKPEAYNGRLAVIASPGSDNYFHWTLDSIPRFHLLEHFSNHIDGYYVNTRHSFQREWLEWIGIPRNRIIPASENRHIIASELIVPSFAGLPGLPTAQGIDFIRSFMPPAAPSEGRRIYVSRADARRRRIVNEEQILPLLRAHRFEVVKPGTMTVCEQMRVFADATAVISPHGAELTNLVYCRPGTGVLEILSPYYLNPCFRLLSGMTGLRHTALVGDGGASVLKRQLDAHHVWSNIKVDLPKLEHALSLM